MTESFEPKGQCEPIRKKALSSGSAFGLKKGPVLIACFIIAAFLSYSLFYGLSSKNSKTSEAKKQEGLGSPSELVQSLPSDYSRVEKRRTPTQTPVIESKGVVGAKETAEEKLLLEQKLKNLRASFDARNSDVSFLQIKAEVEALKKEVVRSRVETLEAAPSRAPLGGVNDRDFDNRQDDKGGFLKEERTNETRLRERLRPQATEYELMAGSIIPGVFLTGINSDLPGQITGQVTTNVYDTKTGHYKLIPQGTRIIGEYDSRVTYGQERVLIVWTRLIFPNAKSISLEAMPGVDLSGYAGVSERVNNHYGKILTGVVFGSLLGAGAQMANGPAWRTSDPTFGQLAIAGMAQNTNDAGQEITRKNLRIQPTLEISPGHRFNVFVTRDVGLEPYN